jgi:hypothetical protein
LSDRRRLRFVTEPSLARTDIRAVAAPKAGSRFDPVEAQRARKDDSASRGDWSFFMGLLLWGMRNNNR